MSGFEKCKGKCNCIHSEREYQCTICGCRYSSEYRNREKIEYLENNNYYSNLYQKTFDNLLK